MRSTGGAVVGALILRIFRVGKRNAARGADTEGLTAQAV
jgi:hypothetical protein